MAGGVAVIFNLQQAVAIRSLQEKFQSVVRLKNDLCI
jgi:hypothetical protein